MSRHRLARALSIAGHPGLLIPVALWASHAAGGRAGETPWAALVAALLVTLTVGVYSALRVRSGSWSHVDASRPRERTQLNLFLLLLLLGSAWVSHAGFGHTRVAMGLLLSAALVGLALLLSRWLKLSLHVSFGMLAVALLWPQMPGAALALLLVAGVAWSRIELGRHTWADVLAATLAGGAAGIVALRALA